MRRHLEGRLLLARAEVAKDSIGELIETERRWADQTPDEWVDGAPAARRRPQTTTYLISGWSTSC